MALTDSTSSSSRPIRELRPIGAHRIISRPNRPAGRDSGQQRRAFIGFRTFWSRAFLRTDPPDDLRAAAQPDPVGQARHPVTLKTFVPAETDLGGMTVGQYLARLAAEATTIINARITGGRSTTWRSAAT